MDGHAFDRACVIGYIHQSQKGRLKFLCPRIEAIQGITWHFHCLSIYLSGEKMNRLHCLLVAIAFLAASAMSKPSNAAEMTFQLINDAEWSVNLKLYSRGESRQEWPSKTKAYSLRPDKAVQQVKITCEAGEQICWGTSRTVQAVSGEVGAGGQRATKTTTYWAGAGERGQRSCESCCHVCKDGMVTPVATVYARAADNASSK